MTQKEEMGKKSVDEMEHWHWPCWEGFARLVCAGVGSHTHSRAWGKLPSILALPGWTGLSGLSAGVQDTFAVFCPTAQPGLWSGSRNQESYPKTLHLPKNYQLHHRWDGKWLPLLPLPSSRPLAVAAEPGFALEWGPQQPPH